MKTRLFLLVLWWIQTSFPLLAQEVPKSHEVIRDTNTLRHFLKTGKFYGHARSYWSATLNQNRLTDYYAWAVGGGIGYQTPKLAKRFQLGISGFFIFNLASSDLARPDPATSMVNRYENGLFDIERPNYHRDLGRLEEFYLKAHFGKKSILTLGRQVPESPFINPQDGRMSPTLTEGAVLDVNEWPHLKLRSQYLWRISPRSTMRWLEIDESMGMYPVGVGLDGRPSQYKGQTESDFIAIFGATYKKSKWEIQLWDTYVDNVLNTFFVKAEWRSLAKGGTNWMTGAQLTIQNITGNGGNPNALLAYAQPGSAVVTSGRIGQESERFDWYLNATHIWSQQRYLMPREWGKEPFYTFMPRERNDGFGNLTAATVNTRFKPQKGIELTLSGGYFHLPDVKNFRQNKYGMPGYSQINLGLTYQFDQYLKGLSAFLLVVRKDKIGSVYDDSRYIFNKVNMVHANLILNYRF